MATQVIQVSVESQDQMDSTINQYIAQGFIMVNRSSAMATMLKKKEFSIIWAVVGLALCVLPLLIYLIIYSQENDQMVEIRLISPSPAPAAEPPATEPPPAEPPPADPPPPAEPPSAEPPSN